MAKQTINIGQAANDKTGDPLRVAFNKVNANFNELYDQRKEWVNPSSNKTWSIVNRAGGVRVMTGTASTTNVTATVTDIFGDYTVAIPRDSTTQTIQEYWDGIDGGYDYTRIVVNGVEYEGFVTTYTTDTWRINVDVAAAGITVGTEITVRYYDYPPYVKWFDAADYPNANNFLGAKIDYYAYVEGRGQRIGYVYFSAMHDEYNNFETYAESVESGEYTDLFIDARPTAENPFKSLWLRTNSPTAEPVSIMWEAKMFYGEGAIHTPEITEND